MSFSIYNLVISATILYAVLDCYEANLFTTTDRLRDLARAETYVMPELQNVVDKLKERIDTLRSIVDDMKHSQTQLVDNELSLAGHPVHAYNLIKRWRQLEAAMVPTKQYVDDSGNVKQIPVSLDCQNNNINCSYWASHEECTKNPAYMLSQCKLSCNVCAAPTEIELDDENLSELTKKLNKYTRSTLPTKDDYEGSAQGLIRLQRTYKLEVDDILTGTIYGYKSRGSFTGDDLHNFGKEALEMNEWGYAVQWLKKALTFANRTVTTSEINIQITRAYLGMKNYKKVKEFIDEAYGKYGKVKSATLCYDEDDNCAGWAQNNECSNNPSYMLRHCSYSCKVCKQRGKEKFPGEYELSNIYYGYQKKMKEMTNANINDTIIAEPNTIRSEQPEWRPVYEELCRGEGMKWYPNAVCRYRPAQIPWNVYKEEILMMNPRIAMVYDVISDREAEEMKDRATNKMHRALVGSDRRHSRERVSTVGWLSDSDPFIKRISERVEIITGLEATLRESNSKGREFISSDDFQAVNYGIGGHYEPHVDYFKGEEGLEKTEIGALVSSSGDRIATFLLYLTDIKAGGGTVYPKVKIRVPPVKNAAAFWFNCRMSGDYDPLTMHAGCPVLLGEKWVCNKWIREFGNEFKRKCQLTRNATYS